MSDPNRGNPEHAAPHPGPLGPTGDGPSGTGRPQGAPHPSAQGPDAAPAADRAAAQAASILDAALAQRQALFRNLEAQRSSVYKIVDEQKVEAVRIGTGAPRATAGGPAASGPSTLGGTPLQPPAGSPASILELVAEPWRAHQALMVQELVTALRRFIAQEVRACLAAHERSADRPGTPSDGTGEQPDPSRS